MHTDARQVLHGIADTLALPPRLMTEALLAKVAEDPTFVHHLQVCASHPRMLDMLLREVAHESQPTASEESATSSDHADTPSNLELMGRASRAVARWAASGFSRLSDEDYRKRLSECSTCEHLAHAPNRVLYQVVNPSPQNAKTICGLCGCDVRRKARLATEHCPDGRWSELSGS